jgi:hypothetical protein
MRKQQLEVAIHSVSQCVGILRTNLKIAQTSLEVMELINVKNFLTEIVNCHIHNLLNVLKL